MPEKKHCYHSPAYLSSVCDLNIYSKLWAVDSWLGVCLQIMMWTQMMLSWPWSNHLEGHDQEKNRPWPRNNIHALFEMVDIEYQELFQQLLTAVLNSKQIQVFHYKICGYPTVSFDSPLSCFSIIYPHWLDTCKYSCFRWERMSHMGISHALDRSAML